MILLIGYIVFWFCVGGGAVSAVEERVGWALIDTALKVVFLVMAMMGNFSFLESQLAATLNAMEHARRAADGE